MVDQVLQSNCRLNRSGGGIANGLRRAGAIALLAGGLFGSGMAVSPTAIAEVTPELLLAQDIVDGLPPPPNVERPEALPAFPQAQPQMPPQAAPPTSIQPAPVRPAPVNARQYWVMINGDSQRLLEQVQQVATTASIQDYQGKRMIVAAFDDSDHAERQVQILASRGIGAQIIRAEGAALASGTSNPSSATVPIQRSAVPAAVAPDLPPPDLQPSSPGQPGQTLQETPSGSPREVEFGGQSPSLNQFPSPPPLPGSPAAAPVNAREAGRNALSPSGSPSRRAYYVVIPGEQNELDAIMNQVIRLGDNFGIAQLVQQSGTRGAHVQIGPFTDRRAANRWNRYFRDFGMNARVYVDR
ncbi:hypothetical protein IFO70_02790 [Phormidium tenue FACHB-886]|nr:hypothetical protein [Phormidium tenue FACHB-886]